MAEITNTTYVRICMVLEEINGTNLMRIVSCVAMSKNSLNTHGSMYNLFLHF